METRRLIGELKEKGLSGCEQCAVAQSLSASKGDVMLCLMIPLAVLLLNVGIAFGQAATQTRRIDLNVPGAMGKVQTENPAHYRKIQAILDGLNKHSPSSIPHWIRTTYKAKEVGFSPYALTTLPAQRRLSFTLDGIQYSGVVTLEIRRAEFYPMRSQ